MVALKAMFAIVAPAIMEPDCPTRKYWTDTTQTVETNSKTIGAGNARVDLTPVKEKWEHDLDIEDFKIKRRAFKEQVAAWKEKRPSVTT